MVVLPDWQLQWLPRRTSAQIHLHLRRQMCPHFLFPVKTVVWWRTPHLVAASSDAESVDRALLLYRIYFLLRFRLVCCSHSDCAHFHLQRVSLKLAAIYLELADFDYAWEEWL